MKLYIALIIIIIIWVYKFDYSIKRYIMNYDIIKKYLYNTQYSKALTYSKLISKYIKPNSKILDFGTATGCMTKILRDKYNHNVYPLDVINQSILNDVKPKIYKCDNNSCIIPYQNKFFDLGIALGVLHHTHNPIHIIKELKRTCKMIIICEDIYNTLYEKYKTYIMDSIVNFEFNNHPHNNKTDMEWRNIFESLNLRLIDRIYRKHGTFLHGIYVLST